MWSLASSLGQEAVLWLEVLTHDLPWSSIRHQPSLESSEGLRQEDPQQVAPLWLADRCLLLAGSVSFSSVDVSRSLLGYLQGDWPASQLEPPNRSKVVNAAMPQQLHTTASLIFNWSYRPDTVQYGREWYRVVKTRDHGSLDPFLVACYHTWLFNFLAILSGLLPPLQSHSETLKEPQSKNHLFIPCLDQWALLKFYMVTSHIKKGIVDQLPTLPTWSLSFQYSLGHTSVSLVSKSYVNK